MLKKLNPSPKENLKNRFHDHPLMLTCQKVFRHYMASMERFDFTTEDLFVEVAAVIDGIFANPQEARLYLSELWDNLKIQMKRKADFTPPQADLDKVCGVLHYVVAATLSLHWREYYNTELVGVLHEIVKRKQVFVDGDEQEQIVSNLCKYAEGLGEWVNKYEDGSEWLSEDIESTITNQSRDKRSLAHGFFTLVPKPERANVVVERLHELMAGKTHPKDIVKPIRAAIDAGAISRPTWGKFCAEFGENKLKSSSSLDNYTNPDKAPYIDAAFQTMVNEFKSLIS